METIFVVFLFIGAFLLGYFVHQRVHRFVNLDEECQKTLKRQRDVANWLKSELASIKRPKMGKKNIDPKKVRLIELIIKRLEK